MSIAVKTDTGWQVLGVGNNGGVDGNGGKGSTGIVIVRVEI